MFNVGKFEWDLYLDGKLPCVTRWVNGGERVRYFSVYHAEKFLLASYLAFISSTVISTCMKVQGRHMTDPEALLLNEINKNHCDPTEYYEFKARQDCVISAKDVYEFYTFLKTCCGKLRSPLPFNAPFGFVCFDSMVVPYVVKDGTKYLPITFFEETSDSNSTQVLQRLMGLTTHLSSLELAYIKFCCMVQGIRTDYILWMQLSTVISLKELESYFPVNIDDLYWPAEDRISPQVFNASRCIGKWITESRSSPSTTPFELDNGNNRIAANQDKVCNLLFLFLFVAVIMFYVSIIDFGWSFVFAV